MYSSIDTMWVLLGAALVFLMQAGFAMLEVGFTRAKNTGNIVMKNVIDVCIGSLLFWFLGFGIMHGQGGALFGGIDLFSKGDYSAALPEGIPKAAFLIFQTVFCATSATIVSGAMAERTKFSAYCIYSAVISLLIYPVSGHWIWGGGFLEQMGFHDFSGSAAVHLAGGCAAFAGAAVLGPRLGKYTKGGSSRGIPGQNPAFGALGILLLWFSWFGFTGCSTLSMTGDGVIARAADIFVNVNLAAAAAACTTMFFSWFRYRKPDITLTLNGALAGLVAVTGCCDAAAPEGAAAIGMLAGFVLVLAIEFVDKRLKIDDPVGAVSVHGVCGALGTVMTGFLSTERGLLYGGGFELLRVQLLGILCVAAWSGITAAALFWLIKKTVGLRVDPTAEIEGLDLHEHGYIGSSALMMPEISWGNEGTEKLPPSAVPALEEGEGSEIPEEKGRLTRVEIITRQEKFEPLKQALNDIGITGMTVTYVMGCGIQKGMTDYYRGAPLEVQLRPKVRVDVVVSKVPVREVIDTARRVLYTGHIGDGKIFIHQVEDAVRVRTGETGYDAMQGGNAE